MNKLISICIPTYERPIELSRNLREIYEYSLLNHEYSIEVCISDNSSSEGTSDVVAYWREIYPTTIRYKRNLKNIGASKNFYNALSMSTGDLVVLLGDDDFVGDTFFECLDSGFLDDRILMCLYDRRPIAPEKHSLYKVVPFSARSRDICGEGDLLDYIRNTNSIGGAGAFISSVVYRGGVLREIIREIEKRVDYNSVYAHVEIFIEIVKRGRWRYLSEPLVYSSIDNDSFLKSSYFERIKLDLQYLEVWSKSGANETVLAEISSLLKRERPWLHFVKAKAGCGRKHRDVDLFVSTHEVFYYPNLIYVPSWLCKILFQFFRVYKGLKVTWSSKRKYKRTLIVQNHVAPYRVALFNQLYKKHNIEVLYLESPPKSRKWDRERSRIRYPYKEVEAKIVPIFGRSLAVSKFSQIPNVSLYSTLVVFTNLPSYVGCIYLKLCAFIAGVDQKIWVTTWCDYTIEVGNRFAQFCVDSFTRVAHATLFLKSKSAIAYSESGAQLSSIYGVECRYSSQYYPLEDVYGFQRPSELAMQRANQFESRIKIKLILIGYLVERKRIEMAIQAVNENDNFELVIVGSGESGYVQSLKEMAADNGRIIFVGYKDGAEKADYIKSADFMLFTTQKDSWGYVVNESLYNCLPVIGSLNSQSVKDLIVDGVNGYTFSSLAELKTKLNCLAGKKKLNELNYIDIAEAAGETIKDFNATVLKNFDRFLVG